MAYELSTERMRAIALKGGLNAAEIIKPLLKKIHLLDTWIAGGTVPEMQNSLKAVKKGDPLKLERTEAMTDMASVRVLDHSGELLGYLPELESPVIAALLNAGKKLDCEAGELDHYQWGVRQRIRVYLVDL